MSHNNSFKSRRLLALLAMIATLFLGVRTAVAGPPILATDIQFACENGNPILKIGLNATTYGFYGSGSGLRYHIDFTGDMYAPGSVWMASSPGVASDGSNPATVLLPSGLVVGSTHTLLITTDPGSAPASGVSSSSYYNFVVGNCKRGMTWQFYGVQQPTGVAEVGCGSCNAYVGNTSCSVALPLLCIRKSGAGFPLAKPPSVTSPWSGGVIGTTTDVVPPLTLVAANQICATQFGNSAWRVAEFHDAGGWKLKAYGAVGDSSKRFWVHINDQPNARCWN
jgi:hypothetical protein